MRAPTKPLTFASRAEWRAWLEQHHANELEAWLIHTKKGARPRYLGYEEAVEEALCFGWIDGLLKRLDAESFLLRYSPRRPDSIWAENNKRRVERLIAEGRMTEAGMAKVLQAKESGEWEAATKREDEDALPPELEQALRSRAGAMAAFQKLAPSRIKQYNWWVASAKRDATRTKRIRTILDELALRKSKAEGDG